ncbi:uncharacterized protein LOC103707372 [Phoenix dactylifera]|uniref:Uncharacterized protein LOC103707372 n=1 Tax=Phoenix dactylifera TaxID=42345 RepID=A0A8B7C236_PHODC|nr:uncharacterized protein LOC103707372 [Phoenix dactylifera]
MASLAAECLERASEEGMDVPEIDSTLLMELLDESHLEEPEDDRLGCVMRSLEAEINPPAAAAAAGIMAVESIHAHEECEDCGLDDILSDLDSHDCSGSPSAYLIDDPFDLVEMEVVAAGSPSGGDMGGWYVDEGGMVGYGDVRESSFYFYGESSMEQAYSPLWE